MLLQIVYLHRKYLMPMHRKIEVLIYKTSILSPSIFTFVIKIVKGAVQIFVLFYLRFVEACLTVFTHCSK